MQPLILMTLLLTCHVLNPTDDIVSQFISFTSRAYNSSLNFSFRVSLLQPYCLYCFCRCKISLLNAYENENAND